MLYSHYAAIPAPLPHRIRFADGSTRTDSTTFTRDELWRAGWTGPYKRPEYDPKLQTIDWDSEALEYIVRPYSFDELQTQHAKVREQRIKLLQSCDWTQITDYDLGADREAWAAYRQSLRDLADAANPFDITWPQPPAISAE